MTPAERERAINYLHKTREDLIRSTQGLSSTQLQYKLRTGSLVRGGMP